MKLAAAEPAKADAKPAAAAPAAGAKKSYTIGVIAKSQSNPVFQAARTGAEDAAKDISAKYNIDVKINWRTPTAEDAQQQAQYVEQLVSSGVNAITISCTDAKVLTGAINAAADKGIPVMTFDSDAPDSKRIGYYGMDDYSCGKQLAKEIADLLNKKGTIAILGTYALGYGARLLAPVFARPAAWRVLDGFIALTMFALAALLWRV
jgi:ribose transport system substrate-binding protein